MTKLQNPINDQVPMPQLRVQVMLTRLLFFALLAFAPVHATHYDAASVAARWALDGYRAVISPLQGPAGVQLRADLLAVLETGC